MIADDPVVEEVRRRRQEICDRFGGDFDKYVEHLMEFQKQFSDRLVNQVTVVKSKPRS